MAQAGAGPPLMGGREIALVLICLATGCAGVHPTASPQPSSGPTASASTPAGGATPTPSAIPTGTPTAPPVATPTAEATPPPPNAIPELHWREIGPLGEPGRVYGDTDEIIGLVGFDGGYVGVHRLVDTEHSYQYRLWYSADGLNWQDYGLFEPGDVVHALGTNGDSALMMVVRGDNTTEAWISDNGLDWQPAEIGMSEVTPDPVPRAVWPREGGWHGAMIEDEESCESPYGCFRGSLWTSDDGLTWRRLGSIDSGDPVAGFTAPEGTVLIQSDFLLASTDDGQSWDNVDVPTRCYEPYSPNFLAAHAPVDKVLMYGGGSHVCWTDPRLEVWHESALPTTSVLEPWRTSLIETSYGIIVAAARDCFEPACPPFVEQFMSIDGTSWASLDEPTFETGDAGQLRIVNGPGGVFGLASFGVPGGQEMRVFQLVAESP